MNRKFRILPIILTLTCSCATSSVDNTTQDTSVYDFTHEKEEGKEALDNYVDLTNYSETNQTRIKEIINEYKNKIDGSNSAEEINAYVAEAKSKIDEYKTLVEEAAELLQEAKTAAKEIARGYANLSEYDDQDKNLIQDALNTLITNIDLAETTEQVTNLLNSYKRYVDSIDTILEKELKALKSQAFSELDSYISDYSVYSSERCADIEEIISSAKEAISDCDSQSDIEEIVATAKEDIDAIPTKREENKKLAEAFVKTMHTMEGVAENHYSIDNEGNINFEGAVGRYDAVYFGDRNDNQYVAFDYYFTPKYINTQYSSISFFFRMYDTSNTYEIVIYNSHMTLQRKMWNSEKGGADTEILQTSYNVGLKNNETYHIQLLACEWTKSFVVNGKTVFSIAEGLFTIGYTGLAAWESSFTISSPIYQNYTSKNTFLDKYQDGLWGECVNARIKEAMDSITNKINSSPCNDTIKEQITYNIQTYIEQLKNATTVEQVSSILNSCTSAIDTMIMEYGEGDLDDETKEKFERMKNSRTFLTNSTVNSSDDYEINSNGYLYEKNANGWSGLYYNGIENNAYETFEFDFHLYFSDSMWSTLNLSFNRNDDNNRYALVFNDIYISLIERINGNEQTLAKINYDNQRKDFIKIKIVRAETSRFISINGEKLFEISDSNLAGGKFALESWQTSYQVGNFKYKTYSSLDELKVENAEVEASVVNIPDIVEPTASSALQNALRGKKLSVLADSISTYEGITNNTEYNSTIGNNGLYYYKQMCSENDTWWMQTINATGMELCVNNAWAGSRCYGDLNDPSTACGNRAINLHNDHTGEEPDVVVTYLGTNDYDMSTPLGTFTQLSDIYENGQYKNNASMSFASAYAMMVHKIQQRYPQAKVFCFTVTKNVVRKDYDVLEEFNNAIKNAANYFNCEVVDLCNDAGYSLDNLIEDFTDKSGIHPNRKGMDKMTNCFIDKLEEFYVK